jgi:hypothetical protein
MLCSVCAWRSVLQQRLASVNPLHQQRHRALSRFRAYTDSQDVFRDKRFKEFAPRAREAVLNAVEELGNSATAAEVASRAALPVQDAEKCLQALAIDGSGSLKVCCSNRVSPSGHCLMEPSLPQQCLCTLLRRWNPEVFNGHLDRHRRSMCGLHAQECSELILCSSTLMRTTMQFT